MKIRIRKPFGFMFGTSEIKFRPGEYRVPEDIHGDAARAAVRMGAGMWVMEKVAPENKVVAIAETKVEQVRSRGKRAKPDA